MQAVFGDAVYITGLTLWGADPMVHVIPEVGTDTETIYALRRYNSKAVMAGLLDRGLVETSRYRDWASMFSEEMSPVPAASPELFWQDNVLRFSESTGGGNRMINASAGPDGFKAALSKMDRSRVRLVHVNLVPDRDYLTPLFSRGDFYPPVRYAYQHPDQPKLPKEALKPAADVEKAYANTDATLKWLTEELLAGDPGVHFLSTAQLKKMVKPDTDFNIRVDALRSATQRMLTAWADKPAPPKYLPVEDHYLSRAEMFQAMADALARRDNSRKFPKTVRVVPVVAPIGTLVRRAMCRRTSTPIRSRSTPTGPRPTQHNPKSSVTSRTVPIASTSGRTCAPACASSRPTGTNGSAAGRCTRTMAGPMRPTWWSAPSVRSLSRRSPILKASTPSPVRVFTRPGGNTSTT